MCANKIFAISFISHLQEVGDSRDSTATRDGVSEGNGALDIKGGRSPCKISKQVG
jgi:hypothetical protein